MSKATCLSLVTRRARMASSLTPTGYWLVLKTFGWFPSTFFFSVVPSSDLATPADSFQVLFYPRLGGGPSYAPGARYLLALEGGLGHWRHLPSRNLEENFGVGKVARTPAHAHTNPTLYQCAMARAPFPSTLARMRYWKLPETSSLLRQLASWQHTIQSTEMVTWW